MNNVRIYTGDACPYCTRAKRLLDRKGVEYEEIHVARHLPEERMRLVELTGRYTVPQVLIDDRPVGGWDELKALDDAGELDPMLGVASG